MKPSQPVLDQVKHICSLYLLVYSIKDGLGQPKTKTNKDTITYIVNIGEQIALENKHTANPVRIPSGSFFNRTVSRD